MGKREMLRVPRRESSVLILVGLFSFSLIFIGTKASQLSVLAWIGAWLVLGALVWHFYRLREEMHKQGHDILWLAAADRIGGVSLPGARVVGFGFGIRF